MTVELTALAAAIEARRVECPAHPVYTKSINENPCTCNGTGTILDPALEPLHEIVWEKCYVLSAAGFPVLRTAFWDAAGEGALAGRLGHAAKAIRNKLLEGSEIWRHWDLATFQCGLFDNQAAVDALENAIRSMEAPSER